MSESLRRIAALDDRLVELTKYRRARGGKGSLYGLTRSVDLLLDERLDVMQVRDVLELERAVADGSPLPRRSR